MNKAKNFISKAIRSQPVLIIAALAAFVTMFIIPPDREYIGYINAKVLIQLFSLMTAVAGLRSIGIFDRVTKFLLGRAGSIRSLGRVLVLLCFFVSMFVTNDVALILFVPLTLPFFEKSEKGCILTVVLETAAANLGSMMTPVGNPQNLFLYDRYGFTVSDFILLTLPVGLVSLVSLMLLCLLLPKEKCSPGVRGSEKISSFSFAVYMILFLICLLTVLRLLPVSVCLAAAVLAALICDLSLLKKVDYALLATFVCFFIFVGNIARIEAIREFFRDFLSGREVLVSLGLSQLISNVPATVMLAEFTENGKGLLLGVNAGGLGTIIASLASLISFQFYRKSENARPGRYLAVFTGVSAALLAVILPTVFLLCL